MPTGYTAELCEKDISFNEFAMTCARAMGACIMLRDEPSGTPIPERFEPSKYNLEKMQVAEAELERLAKLPNEECAAAANAEYQRDLSYHTAEVEKEIAREKRLKAMLDQVFDWKAPSPDHEGLRNFMLEQLDSTIKFDCGDSYHAKLLKKLRCATPEEWRAAQLAKAQKDINYHHQAYIEEVDRVESRNKWLKDLRASLGVTPHEVANER